ncbi:hypothetical protein FACS18949_05740 [Clostridia bacterium]|nr:hypothetical protein FACS18949_05740 [Clostridia bacterium]
MFIVTAKLDKKRLTAIVVAAGVLLIALIVLLSMRGARGASATTLELPSPKGVSTNDERVAFLEGYGWQVASEPIAFEEVLFPEAFDDVFADYNALQTSQGFALEKYKGKRVMRYTYEIENYPGAAEGTVRANLFVYRDTVIGGDVSSVVMDGFMHGFMKS